MAEGQRVEIPALHVIRTAGTHGEGAGGEREDPCKRAGRAEGKTAARKGGRVTRTERRVGKRADPVPGKAAMALRAPVPQTDTGGQGEKPQADGRSTVKELGKMAP